MPGPILSSDSSRYLHSAPPPRQLHIESLGKGGSRFHSPSPMEYVEDDHLQLFPVNGKVTWNSWMTKVFLLNRNQREEAPQALQTGMDKKNKKLRCKKCTHISFSQHFWSYLLKPRSESWKNMTSAAMFHPVLCISSVMNKAGTCSKSTTHTISQHFSAPEAQAQNGNTSILCHVLANFKCNFFVFHSHGLKTKVTEKLQWVHFLIHSYW